MQFTQAAVHLAKDWPFSGGGCGAFTTKITTLIGSFIDQL